MCRLLVSLLKSHQALFQTPSVRSAVCEILQTTLLPTTCVLLNAPPGLVTELWNVLSLLPYDLRCELYTTCYSKHGGGRADVPAVRLAKAKASGSISSVLKRIANDTKNMKQIGRQLAKVAHANPGVTFDRLLYHAESYENFITPVVQSLAFMTTLALDVLSFMIIDHLNNPSKKKGDKAHDGFDAQWFKNLAMFCGVFYRAHPGVEMQVRLPTLKLPLKP